MSNSARIDELRIKFEDNNRRYFAPLANEYRKAGDLEQAIALCREHLPQQPGHMSGYIVFGQALYEAGELTEAEAVFTQALDLDPENLIALRHLGDIARANKDTRTAERWYGRALDADPRNDDIAAQLASLVSARVPTPKSVPIVTAPPNENRTPAFGMPFGGFGAMPTPDAAMRSIDPDAVTKQARSFEPIDLDDLGGFNDASANELIATAATTSFGEPSADESESVPERITVDGVTNVDREASTTDDIPDPVVSEIVFLDEPEIDSAADFASGIASAAVEGEGAGTVSDDEDPFAYPIETEIARQPMDSGAFASFSSMMSPADALIDAADDQTDEVNEADESEAFEAGLVAPEWPDTSDLVMRVVSPRTPTPAAITPASFTPISTSAYEDAPAAFGREATDPVGVPVVNDVSMADEVADIEAEYEPFDTMSAAPNTTELDFLISADEFADDDSEDFTVEISETVTVITTEFAVNVESVLDDEIETPLATVEAALVDTDDIQNIVDNDVEGVRTVSEALAVEVTDASDNANTDDVNTDGATVDADVEVVAIVEVGADAENVDDAVNDVDVEAEAEADNSVETTAAVDLYATPGFDEISAALASDAAAAGDDSTVHVAEHDGNDAQQSHEFVNRPTPSAASNAFVTETMAELLVSQGFTGRAVEVYKELVRRRPYDPVLTSRLQQLTESLQAADVGTDTGAVVGREADASDDIHDDIHDDQRIADEFADAIIEQRLTPVMNTAVPTPAYFTPAFVTPFLQPAVAAHQTIGEARPSAREVFAALASRRVPRRTPPQSFTVVAERSEGLSSLFGTDTSNTEDAAARALADAFAPVSDEDYGDVTSLEFELNRSTPAFSHLVTPSESQPAVSTTPTPSYGQAQTPASSNEGFSFDRFFPDPATRHGTPTESLPTMSSSATPTDASPVAMDPPVADDLAQFSQWLKGLNRS